MIFLKSCLLIVLVLLPVSALAGDITSLAACTTKVFTDINRKQAWSGKAPSGCFAKVSVYRRIGGLGVTAWILEPKGQGWERLSFTAVESIDELESAKGVAAANRDVMARAKRLERCFQAGPGDDQCQARGATELQVEEESGVRDVSEIRIPDGGRETVVEYVVSDTEETPTLPADIPNEPLPPGTEIKVFTIK